MFLKQIHFTVLRRASSSRVVQTKQAFSLHASQQVHRHFSFKNYPCHIAKKTVSPLAQNIFGSRILPLPQKRSTSALPDIPQVDLPNVQLKNKYDSLNRQVTRSDYKFECIEEDGLPWWLCSFTCPITQQIFYPCNDSTLSSYSSCFSSSSLNARIINGKVHYSGKKIAKQACSLATLKYFDDNGILDPRKATPNSVSVINLLHQACEPSISLRNAFQYEVTQVETEDNPNRQYYSASFRSPITGEIFEAGTLINNNGMIIKDGKIYYSTKKMATAASAGRAIDCFYFRQNWLTIKNEDMFKTLQLSNEVLHGYSKYCEEEPYHSSPEVQIIFDVEGYYKSKYNEKPQKMTLSMTSPKSVIHNRYQSLLQGDQKLLFNNSSIEVPCEGTTHTYWTSTVICPITNEHFPAGSLLDLSNNDNNDNDVNTTISSNTEMQNVAKPSPGQPLVIDNAVYYLTEKRAEQAAAGRACDCLVQRKFWESFGLQHMEIPRYCEEDPGSEDEEEEEEDYVIQYIPGPGIEMPDKSKGRRTIETLLEAWKDTPLVNISTTGSNHDSKSNSTPGFSPSITSTSSAPNSWSEISLIKDEAISNAVSLYHLFEPKSKGRAFSKTTNPQSKFLNTWKNLVDQSSSYEMILMRLGEANSIPQIPTKSSPSADYSIIVETILEKLMSGLSNEEPNQLNVEVINAYIKCVNKKCPKETAAFAESLLLKMIKGEKFNGHQLPRPTITTFNTVMNIWNIVPGQRRKVINLFEILEGVADLKPNRDTFIAILASLCNDTDENDESNTFDALFATEIIEKMKQASHTGTIIDAEVYNAPLPWSGGMRKTGSLLSMCEWDNYSTFRELPTCPEKDKKYLEALSIEKWLLMMKNNDGVIESISPSIETYESLIQAWVRTCTKDGINRAESFASELIDAALHGADVASRPRLQTFHPIIAGWAHSGTEEGPERVKEWIQKLESMSSIPELKPDLRMKSALISAWRSRLKRVQEKERIEDISSSLPHGALEECSQFLSSIQVAKYSDLERDYFDGIIFATVLQIWGNANATSTLAFSSKESLLSNMLEIVGMFDNLLDSFHNFEMTKEQNNDKNDKESSKYRNHPQLLNLISRSFVIYRTLVSHFIKIHSSLTSDEQHLSIMSKKLAAIENMVLRSEEFESILKKSSLNQVDVFTHFDLFSYEQDIPTIHLHDLYEEILNYCKVLSHPAAYGDSVRITMRVLKVLVEKEKHGYSCELTKHVLQVIDVIDSIIPNEREKALIIRNILMELESNDINDSIEVGTITDAASAACPNHTGILLNRKIKSKAKATNHNTQSQNKITKHKKRRHHRKMRWPKNRPKKVDNV